MFIPTYRNAMFDDIDDQGIEYVDKRGWCNLERAKARFQKEREKKANTPNALLIYKAEYCFTIDEALSLGGSNMFPREELAEQLTQLEIHKTVPLPEPGNLIWIKNDKGENTGVK